MKETTHIHNVEAIEMKSWEGLFNDEDFLTEIKIRTKDEIIGFGLFSDNQIKINNH